MWTTWRISRFSSLARENCVASVQYELQTNLFVVVNYHISILRRIQYSTWSYLLRMRQVMVIDNSPIKAPSAEWSSTTKLFVDPGTLGALTFTNIHFEWPETINIVVIRTVACFAILSCLLLTIPTWSCWSRFWYYCKLIHDS